jgi:hypothetical protein
LLGSNRSVESESVGGVGGAIGSDGAVRSQQQGFIAGFHQLLVGSGVASGDGLDQSDSKGGYEMSVVLFQYITSYLTALPALLQGGANLVIEIEALVSQLNMFQAQNRDPSPEEWSAQNQRLTVAIQGLMAANKS